MNQLKVLALIILSLFFIAGCDNPSKSNTTQYDKLTKENYEKDLFAKAYIKEELLLLDTSTPVVNQGRQEFECFIAKTDGSQIDTATREITHPGFSSTGTTSYKVIDLVKSYGIGSFYFHITYKIFDKGDNEILNGSFKSNSFELKNNR